MRDALLKYNRGAIKTDEKTRTLWRVTAVLAAELALLALIVSLTAAGARNVPRVQRRACGGGAAGSSGGLGLYDGEISGLYDLGTRRGVKNFQREHGLDPSGEANGRTAAVLGLSTASCDASAAKRSCLPDIFSCGTAHTGCRVCSPSRGRPSRSSRRLPLSSGASRGFGGSCLRPSRPSPGIRGGV